MITLIRIICLTSILSFEFIPYEYTSKNKPEDVYLGPDENTEAVLHEYEAACVRKTIHLSGEGYTCKDLKKYLKSLGYKL